MIVIMCIAMFGGCSNQAKKDTTSSSDSTESSSTSGDKNTPKSGTINWLCQDYGDVMQRLSEEYKKTVNSNVNFNIEIYPRTKLMEVIEIKLGAGESDFDLLFVDQPLIAGYTWKDYLLPLTDFFTEGQMNNFADADRAAGMVDGEFMAAPLMSSSCVLLINKTLLEQAGMVIDQKYYDLKERITWEKLKDLAIEFQSKMDRDHTKGLWGYAFDQAENVYQILALGNSLGEIGIGPDGVTVDGYLNTDGWVKALTFYQNLYTEWGVSPNGVTNDEVRELFASGKIAFYNTNSIRAKNFGFDCSVILHPYFEGGIAAVPTGSWHLGINKNSKNVDLTKDFLVWATADKGAEFWMLANNQVPAQKSLLEGIINGNYPAFNEWPLYATKVGVMQNLSGAAFPRPTSVGFLEFDTAMTAMFQDLRSGADVKTALENTTAQLESSFKRYR
ncbi:MAG TPA: extracellular solute-binding protein [Clostridiaceae bacterium]|nr:extracellular solute-binding protein [Clostridiaceae bacterium]